MILMDILNDAGVDIKKSMSDPNEVTICCPFCEDKGHSADGRFRLGINVFKGLAHCYNCDWRGGSLQYVATSLCKAFSLPMSYSRYRRAYDQPEYHKEKKLSSEHTLPAEYEPLLAGDKDLVAKKARAYLDKRGVTTTQILKHKIGYAAAGRLAWRVLFPLYGDKKADGVMGCVGRAISVETKPKYLMPVGIKLLWNGHRQAETAVLVEGVMDALRVEQALLSFRNTIAVAQLGSSLTDTQLNQLRKYDNIVVFPDWDEAGVKGAIEVSDRLADSMTRRLFAIVPESMTEQDPGAFETDKIIELLHSAKEWSAATRQRLQLSATRRVAC